MVQIDNLDECLKFFDNAPATMLKATKTAMRSGCSACNRSIRANTPARFRRLVRAKVKVIRGKVDGTFGMFNGHQRAGHQNPGAPIDDWFKAYWMNYGTLQRRDPNHHFKNPVRKSSTAQAKRRVNKLGQPAQNYYEQGLTGWQSTYMDAFRKSLEKQIQNFNGIR